MQMRALEQRTIEPIMATIAEGEDLIWRSVIVIHPDDWDDAKAKYGDRLEKLF